MKEWSEGVSVSVSEWAYLVARPVRVGSSLQSDTTLRHIVIRGLVLLRHCLEVDGTDG